MIRYIFICFFFIFSIIPSSFADEKVLKVAINKNIVPFSYIDKDKKAKGFFLDYLALFFKKTEYKFEFIPSSFSEISPDIDIYLGIQKNKSFEKELDYLSPIYPSEFKIYLNKEKNIKNVADLEGKVLGFVKNGSFKQDIKKRVKNIHFKQFDTFKLMYNSLLNNKIDGLIDNKVTLWFELVKEFDFNRLSVLRDFSSKNWFHFAINKNKKELLLRLNKKVSVVSKKELLSLEEKWIINKELFYLKKEDKSLFTEDEIAYIQNAKPIKIGIDTWPPLYSLDKNNQLKGLVSDFLNKITEISGLETQIVKGTWNSLFKDFKNKKIDLLPSVFYSKERTKYGLFSDSYINMRSSIFIKESKEGEINSFYDLSGKKLAVIKNGALLNSVKKRFPKIEIVEAINTSDCLKKLINNEVDAFYGADLIVFDLLKKELIVGIKAVLQNDIKVKSTHFLSQKNNPLLHSILQKSLNAIPNSEKNKIISKWLNPSQTKKELNVAFSFGKEPYIINKKYIKGIEYDLISKVLNMSSLSIKNQKNVSIVKLATLLLKEPKFDMAVGVQEDKKSGLFYSDIFLNFQNVVVSRKNDNLDISSINDLKGKKVIGFKGAYSYLGEKYYELFSPENRDKNYLEYEDQEKQVKDFIKGFSDAIVLDKNIFRWYIKKFKKNSLHNYKFDYVFSALTGVKVAFKDENLKNIFNRNLRKIKKNGDFERIFNDYYQGLIFEKVKIKSLISSLVARNIFTDEIEELDELVKIIGELPFIKKIEVFNNNDDLLSASSSINLSQFSLQDSYHFILNVPQKVGYIKIYFDTDSFLPSGKELYYIPSLELFKDLRSYPYFKEVYKKFNYINSKVRFTIAEQNFIKNNPIIKFSEINWKPLSIIDKKVYSGLMADYINIIQDVSGLKFDFTPSEKFVDVINQFKKGEIDFTPIIGGFEAQRDYGLLTDSYLTFSYAIVGNEDTGFINDFNSLNFKKVALPKEYTANIYIKKNYPKVEIIETDTIEEAFNMVSQGEAYATVEAMPVSIFYIKNYYPDLKIVGISEDKFTLNFLVQKSKSELQSIINKVLSSITYKQKETIQDKWINVKINTAMDYSILYKAIGIFIFLFLIFFFFYSKLSKAKKQLTLKTKALKEQKEIFETLFTDSTDSLALLKNGKFIDCNNSVLTLLGFSSKKDFINISPHDISPMFQDDGTLSIEKAKTKIGECLKKGTSSFEWIHQRVDGKNIWVDVLLTKIQIQKQDVLYVVWRDITDKKSLEEQVKKRNKELEKSNNELECSLNNLRKAQEQLVTSEKMASLGGLVAGVAHEVNTPVGIGLTGISHLLELSRNLKDKYASQDMSKSDFEDYLVTVEELAILINSNLRRAAELVKSFKRVAVDQTSEVKRKFELKEYIEEVLSSLYNISKKTKIKIEVKSSKRIDINSYPGAISQIITNLIMNSLIHGYDKNDSGNIMVELESINNKIVITYKDDGKGINKENLARIFDPFFTTNRENGGSGLGLNIIYNIVTNTLGGTISCSSEINHGVKFIITFKSI